LVYFILISSFQFPFWHSSLILASVTSDSDDGSENILVKSCGEDVSDMSDEDFPVRRKKRFTVKKGVELRKNQLKANQAEKGKIHLEYIFSLRTYRD